MDQDALYLDSIKDLREARKRRGLTERQIADAVGVASSAVSRWERGLQRPRVTQYVAWRALLEQPA